MDKNWNEPLLRSCLVHPLLIGFVGLIFLIPYMMIGFRDMIHKTLQHANRLIGSCNQIILCPIRFGIGDNVFGNFPFYLLLRYFPWKVLYGRLPTVDKLASFGVTNEGSCVFCHLQQESCRHLFFNCPFCY